MTEHTDQSKPDTTIPPGYQNEPWRDSNGRSYSVTPEMYAAVRERIDLGQSRNEIARGLKLSGAFVSGVAFDLGHRWAGTPKVAEALEAQREQIAATRARVEAKLWAAAEKALDDMNSPVDLIQFEAGGAEKAGEFRTHWIPEPTPADQRNLMTVTGIAVQRASELARASAESAENAGGAVVDRIASGLIQIGEILQAKGVDPTATPAEDTTAADLLAELDAQNRDEGELTEGSA